MCACAHVRMRAAGFPHALRPVCSPRGFLRMHHGRLSRVFLPPSSGEGMTDERARNVASMRMIYVGLALGLDISLYLLLRNAPSLRPEIIRLFAIVNIGLMSLDLGLTYLFL